MKYHTIVADPPWPYADRINAENRGAVNHYDVMTLREIADFGSYIDQWKEQDCHLYLWTTNSFMGAALDVMLSWGFGQKTILTWVKPQIGMGHYYRNNTEHVLFGVRGKQPVLRKNAPTSFAAPRLAHSEKPQEFYDLVQSVSPGPYLDVFARKVRPGWDAWGDEVCKINVNSADFHIKPIALPSTEVHDEQTEGGITM